MTNITIKKTTTTPKNKTTKQSKSINQSPSPSQTTDLLYELCGMTDWITSYSDSGLSDITLTTLYSYLKNPYSNIKEIRNASKYLSHKHGILRDVNNLFKYLPTLNYHLSWSSFDDPKKISKYEKKVNDFLDQLNIKQLTRDGLYEIAEQGTIVTCLRKEKYIQILELDNLVINNMLNGKWVVKYDLSTIKSTTTQDITQVIESLPDEVTVQKYNLYKTKGAEARYVELKNCDVISFNSTRNYPYGFPFSMGAWASLIQKEIISKVERSVADRLIKNLLIMVLGKINEDKNGGGTPVPKALADYYFNQIKDLLIKKDSSTSTDTSNNGVGLATLPDFIKLDPVKVDTTMFSKDLYSKINNDIFMNLGVSSTLIYGAGENSNFSSAQVNNEKIFRYIFGLLEQFEIVINGYIKQLLPKDLGCKFFFEKTTFLDKDKMIDRYEKLYQTTGIFAPWAQSLSGNDYHYLLSQARYEKEILKTDDYLNPPVNPFTTSGNEGAGRPEGDVKTKSGDDTKKNNSNKTPKPSTS